MQGIGKFSVEDSLRALKIEKYCLTSKNKTFITVVSAASKMYFLKYATSVYRKINLRKKSTFSTTFFSLKAKHRRSQLCAILGHVCGYPPKNSDWRSGSVSKMNCATKKGKNAENRHVLPIFTHGLKTHKKAYLRAAIFYPYFTKF